MLFSKVFPALSFTGTNGAFSQTQVFPFLLTENWLLFKVALLSWKKKYGLEKMNSEHKLNQGTLLLIFQQFALCSMDNLHLLGFPVPL